MKKIEEVILANGQKRRRVYTENVKPSKTDQQYAKETDVNYILSRYQKTGQLTHISKIQGQYADVSSIPNLYQALQNVKLANDSFMELPAEIRKKFMNSPALMIEYLQDPANDSEAIKLGLKPSPILPEEVVEPQPEKKDGEIPINN